MAGQQEWRAEVHEWLLVGMAERGLNQNALASLTGISQPQISKYVLGKDTPGDDRLRLLAAALERPPPRLLEYTAPVDLGVSEDPIAFESETDRLLALWRRLRAEQRAQVLNLAETLATA